MPIRDKLPSVFKTWQEAGALLQGMTYDRKYKAVNSEIAFGIAESQSNPLKFDIIWPSGKSLEILSKSQSTLVFGSQTSTGIPFEVAERVWSYTYSTAAPCLIRVHLK